MACPICGAEDRRDDATGYCGPDLCPECKDNGYTEALIEGKVQIINEREPEPVSEMDQVRR